MACLAEWIFRQLFRCLAGNNTATVSTTAWSHVNDIVSIADHIKIMFDDYNGGTVFNKGLEYLKK